MLRLSEVETERVIAITYMRYGIKIISLHRKYNTDSSVFPIVSSLYNRLT